jgi:putative membrane protein
VPGFLLRLLITSLGLWVADLLVPGMTITGLPTLLAAALLLGVVNATVRPLIVLLTLPITVVTLGLFLLVINAGMLGFVAALLDGFVIRGFGSALLGSVIMSVTSWAASWYIGSSGRVEILIVERRNL